MLTIADNIIPHYCSVEGPVSHPLLRSQLRGAALELLLLHLLDLEF